MSTKDIAKTWSSESRAAAKRLIDPLLRAEVDAERIPSPFTAAEVRGLAAHAEMLRACAVMPANDGWASIRAETAARLAAMLTAYAETLEDQ